MAEAGLRGLLVASRWQPSGGRSPFLCVHVRGCWEQARPLHTCRHGQGHHLPVEAALMAQACPRGPACSHRGLVATQAALFEQMPAEAKALGAWPLAQGESQHLARLQPGHRQDPAIGRPLPLEGMACVCAQRWCLAAAHSSKTGCLPGGRHTNCATTLPLHRCSGMCRPSVPR